LDSTILNDAVATQDTVTQIIAAVRRVAREVPGTAEVIAAQARAHDYTQAGEPRIAWDNQQARAELVDGLVRDAHRILGHLPEQELGPAAAEAVGLIALVAGQDVEPAPDSDGRDGRWAISGWRIACTAPDRVISTVAPDTRHAHKTRNQRRDSYKAHLVVEPAPRRPRHPRAAPGALPECWLIAEGPARTPEPPTVRPPSALHRPRSISPKWTTSTHLGR
jgi:hypothetical protein